MAATRSSYSMKSLHIRLYLATVAIFSAAFSVNPTPATAGTTVVLRQGLNAYSGAEDTTIFRDAPNNSAGGFPYVFAGTTRFSEPRRSLLKFDLQGVVPQTATITSATLQLYLEFDNSGIITLSLHGMTRAWNEGANPLAAAVAVGQGAPAQAGDSTWSNVSHNTVAWATPGGEFAAMASATGTVGDVGTFLQFSGTGLVNNIQNWVAAPTSNHGWALLGQESSAQTAKRFWSSEADDTVSAFRPQLSIEYDTQSAVQDWALY